jgi:hypothetical protein
MEARGRSDRWAYTDLAIAPPKMDEFDTLDLYHATAGGEAALARKYRHEDIRPRVRATNAPSVATSKTPWQPNSRNQLGHHDLNMFLYIDYTRNSKWNYEGSLVANSLLHLSKRLHLSRLCKDPPYKTNSQMSIHLNVC